MSKILEAGEIGFGILIENDAGYISQDINKNVLFENYKTNVYEPILINCVLQKWGVKNKNGRIYPPEVLIPQVEAYNELIKNNSAIAEADHPDSSVISLHNISHMITKMWWGNGNEKNVLYGQLKLIISPGFLKFGVVSVIGDKILLYLQNNIKIGISSRGVGTLKEINGENIVQKDFELIGFDLVATPSTPGAYLMPDNKFKFNENNIIKGKSINENDKKIINAINKFIL